MQRYFVRSDQIKGDLVTISGDDAHHIFRVMRLSAGDPVIVCDNSGKQYDVRLETVSGEAVTGKILNEQMAPSEPRLRVTIAQSLIKGDKMDWVIQKGTELGVTEFLPFKSVRSVVKLERTKALNRRKRWQKIAKEAAEQAHRGRIPVVSSPLSWSDLLDKVAAYDVAVMAYEWEQAQSLPALWQTLPTIGSCLCIIGPEGGFDRAEVEAAQAVGVQSVHLGPRILRAETAALTAIICAMWASGEMEGKRE